MADPAETANSIGAQNASCGQAAARIRDWNELLIERAVAEGNRTLDAYERALTTLVTVTEKVDATPLGWLAALAQMHANFLRDVSAVYTASVRILLD